VDVAAVREEEASRTLASAGVLPIKNIARR
jgi:hypothetical protein